MIRRFCVRKHMNRVQMFHIKKKKKKRKSHTPMTFYEQRKVRGEFHTSRRFTNSSNGVNVVPETSPFFGEKFECLAIRTEMRLFRTETIQINQCTSRTNRLVFYLNRTDPDFHLYFTRFTVKLV